MSARRPATAARAALLAAVLSAFAAAAPAAAETAPAGVQPMAGPDGLYRIASPAAPNRHGLEGHSNLDVDNADKLVPSPGEARIGDVVVKVSDIQAPATCTSQHPLTAGLYSPEGHFMHRVEANGRGGYDLVIPRIPARYVLKLSIADPACAGLSYRFTLGPIVGDGYDPNGYKCNNRARAVAKAERMLKKVRLAERKARAGRPRRRIHALVVAQRARVKDARAYYAKGCP